MIQTAEQALFCLMSPTQEGADQANLCAACKFGEMCGRVVAIIAEYQEKMEKGAEQDDC